MIQENVLNQNTFFLRGPRTFKQANGSLIFESILHGILPEPTDVQLSSVVGPYTYTTGGVQLCRVMKVTMSDLLWWFSQTECHDPRDRIFALLGAASDAKGLNIIVDYSRTENEVLINLATRMIEYHRTLDILRTGNPQMTATRGLPSWVPYWDTHDPIYASEIVYHGNLKAADAFDLECAFEDEGKVLTVNGLRLGKLEASLGTWNRPTVNYADLLKGKANEEVRQQVKMLIQIQERWGNSKDYEYALACTLVSSTVSQYNEVDSEETLREGVLRAFRNCVKLLKHSLESTASQSSEILSFLTASSSPASMTDNDKQMALKFMRDIFIRSRTLWTINGRHLCLAPAAALAGDLVTVLLGGPLLYVLRPTKDDGNFLFIGTAYVHGFMHGEAVQTPTWQQKLETF